MKYFGLLLLCSLIISCNLKEAFSTIEKIDSDLKEKFKHQDITTTLSWGTNDENNKITITFFNFNLDSLSYSELTTLASRIGSRVCRRNPDLKNIDNIEINFTKELIPDNPSEMITFKLKGNCGK